MKSAEKQNNILDMKRGWNFKKVFPKHFYKNLTANLLYFKMIFKRFVLKLSNEENLSYNKKEKNIKPLYKCA